MNILAIADRQPTVSIGQLVRQQPVDLIVTLGDLTREDLLPLADITDIPKIGVYGNHDSGNYMAELGITNMHLKVWEFLGFTFGGFQGCVRYKQNPDAIMYTQQEAATLMQDFPAVDIFLAHCPPRGVNDEEELAHQGFQALRNYVLEQKPQLLLHGHTYPRSPATQLQVTRIEYVFGYKIIAI